MKFDPLAWWFINVLKKLSPSTCKVVYCISDFKCWPWMWKWKLLRLWKWPIVWLNNAYLFILLVGVGGRGSWNELAAHVGDCGGSQSPSRPSLCIESVPVWLLPQFPPLLNIGPETAVVVAGWVCPPWLGSPLLSHFRGRESPQVRLDYSRTPDVRRGTGRPEWGVGGVGGHLWSTWVSCLRYLHVWSYLCSVHIRSVFKYQVSPPRKHIKLTHNCHYLSWELTSPFFSVGPSSSTLWPSPGALCCRNVTGAAHFPLILHLLMAKLDLNSGVTNSNGRVLVLYRGHGMGFSG